MKNTKDIYKNHILIDINSYDWENRKLTRKEKLFIVYFTLPFQECFEDSTKSALKAGYKKSVAYLSKYKMLRKDDIKYFINKFRERLLTTSLESAFNDIIQEKIKRYKFNVQDYYKCQKIEDKQTGQTKIVTSIKPLNELTREESSIIDNIQINASGIATYNLPKKDKIMNEILKIYSSISKDNNATNTEIETTLQTVKDNIRIALNFSKNNDSECFIEESKYN